MVALFIGRCSTKIEEQNSKVLPSCFDTPERIKKNFKAFTRVTVGIAENAGYLITPRPKPITVGQLATCKSITNDTIVF